MGRVENWDIALFRWMRGHIGFPFDWGINDCATLARGAVAVMYGEDLVPLLPAWDSLRTAKDASEEVGSIRQIFEGLNATRVHPRKTQSGDIALTPGDDLPQLAVVWCDRALVSRVETGVSLVAVRDLADGTEFWRLPNA